MSSSMCGPNQDTQRLKPLHGWSDDRGGAERRSVPTSLAPNGTARIFRSIFINSRPEVSKRPRSKPVSTVEMERHPRRPRPGHRSSSCFGGDISFPSCSRQLPIDRYAERLAQRHAQDRGEALAGLKQNLGKDRRVRPRKPCLYFLGESTIHDPSSATRMMACVE